MNDYEKTILSFLLAAAMLAAAGFTASAHL